MTNNTEKKQQYMFDNTQALEAERLAICNETHNPYSLKFLAPYINALPKNSQVMELGCGGGALAVEVAQLLPKESTLHLIDRSLEQLDRAQDAISKIEVTNSTKIKIHALDLLINSDKINELGKMDLIYCRWVICHIPNNNKVQAIATILKSLKPGGIFILEDGDNSSVSYSTKDKSALPDYAIEANKRFHEISQKICTYANIDIQYNAEKQTAVISKGAEKAGLQGGEVISLGQYRLTLKNHRDKKLLSTPWRTAIQMIFAASNIKNYTQDMAEDLIAPAEKCNDDDNIQAEFLTQAGTAYHAPVA